MYTESLCSDNPWTIASPLAIRTCIDDASMMHGYTAPQSKDYLPLPQFLPNPKVNSVFIRGTYLIHRVEALHSMMVL